MITKKQLQFLLAATGENPTRLNLEYVEFDFTPERVQMTAMNAFIIKRVTMPNVTALEGGPRYAHYQDIKKQTSLMTAKESLVPTYEGLGLFSWSRTSNAASPPNVSRITDSAYGALGGVLGLNVDLIKAVLAGSSADVVKITSQSGKAEDPIKFEWYESPEYAAWIMPVRLNW